MVNYRIKTFIQFFIHQNLKTIYFFCIKSKNNHLTNFPSVLTSENWMGIWFQRSMQIEKVHFLSNKNWPMSSSQSYKGKEFQFFVQTSSSWEFFLNIASKLGCQKSVCLLCVARVLYKTGCFLANENLWILNKTWETKIKSIPLIFSKIQKLSTKINSQTKLIEAFSKC